MLAKEVLVSGLRRAVDKVRWIVEDVDDDTCFWEPATPCWSVREGAIAGPGWGTGAWICEETWPPPRPLPITTIAWRIAHLAVWTEVYRAWTFDGERTRPSDIEVPGDRDGLVAWLMSAQQKFTDRVESLDGEELVELRPAHWGPSLPIHQLVSTIISEHDHHGAEIGVLLDIRRGHARVQPPPATA